MNSCYWAMIVTQVIYVVLSFMVALLLWKLLPQASEASIHRKQWKLGGAFAGFAFTLLVLVKTGPLSEASDDVDLVQSGPSVIVSAANNPSDYRAMEVSTSEMFAFNPDFSLEENDQSLKTVALTLYAKRCHHGVNMYYLFTNQQRYKTAKSFLASLKKQVGASVYQKTVHVHHDSSSSLRNHHLSYFTITYVGGEPEVTFEVEGLYIQIRNSQELYDVLYRKFSKAMRHW